MTDQEKVNFKIECLRLAIQMGAGDPEAKAKELYNWLVNKTP